MARFKIVHFRRAVTTLNIRTHIFATDCRADNDDKDEENDYDDGEYKFKDINGAEFNARGEYGYQDGEEQQAEGVLLDLKVQFAGRICDARRHSSDENVLVERALPLNKGSAM